MKKERASKTLLRKTALSFDENCFHVCAEALGPLVLWQSLKHVGFISIKWSDKQT